MADNFHQGGKGVLIDIQKGQLVGNGIDKKLNESENSITNIKFDGFQIPYWEEIKNMVLEASLINDKVNLIGWDVAISKNGPLIIEGNRGPGFDLVQVLLKKGAKYMLDNLLEEVKIGKLGKDCIFLSHKNFI
ncbi:MAG: sugar-transfer associated ATP-grasp domain-containing protein [Clostridia bacterium]|nr:sugar-transfer associated ATP-grasp domain-containing protein [Clostridia bacterium]